jgi:hypothetical protein
MKRKTAGNVIRAQGAAFKLIEQYGFRHPSEIDLEAVALDRGIKVRHGGLSGCEARLLRVGDRGTIRVRDANLKAPRTRFAIAHEIGHWELHKTSQAFVCTSETLRDYKTDPMEAEANFFASELLMPAAMVRPIIKANEPSLRTAKLISDEFAVSLTAASIKVFMETQHECVLVMSKDGFTSWWMSGSDRYGIWLQSKQRVSPHSIAYYVAAEPRGDSAPELVPTDAWFLHLDAPEKVEVSEESVALGGTGFILSMLTISNTE